jgi:hypothetical protein
MKGLLIALALMLLSGCALFRTQHNTVPRLQLAPGQFVTLPAPRALGLNLSGDSRAVGLGLNLVFCALQWRVA